MSGDAFRAEVLRAHGARGAALDELLAYTPRTLRAPDAPPPFPLPDEPFVGAWERYAAEGARAGVWETLRARLPQLRFPVEAGVSQRDAYRAATRRGEAAFPAEGLVLRRPEALTLFLHPTPAGRLPVLVAEERDDFVALVRSLSRQSEPSPIPGSMGAVAVGGFVNWDRVAAHRRAWEAAHPEADGEAWREEWRRLAGQKELYQDRFVLLSRGPYSGVPAAEVGEDDASWDAASLVVRLEHECAHYFSRRVFGSMLNHAFDELVADYAGIVAAAGRYRAAWARRFFGIETPGRFRPGGRLGNYRGDPPLSDAAFEVLRSVVDAAVETLEAYDAARAARGWGLAEKAATLSALFASSLEELAAEDGPARLERRRLETGSNHVSSLSLTDVAPEVTV
ncbi:MAG TPA: hypothetical protein VHG91_18850 [Longimicrobium sp.]|nr:hypothetical protein [Longimicrobium sp.]